MSTYPPEWFNPNNPSPSTILPAPSTAPTSTEVRPVLLATTNFPLQGGKRKQTRRAKKGGFVPSIMGPFAANAQAAIVPAALYLVYHTMVPKNIEKTVGGLMKKVSRKFRKTRKH